MFQTLESLAETVIDGLPDRGLIFIHTPLCGTCKVARRMLGIISEIKPSLTIYEVDANFVSQKLHEWKIRSIPALLYMDKPQDTITIQYAMSDVTTLLNRVQTFFG